MTTKALGKQPNKPKMTRQEASIANGKKGGRPKGSINNVTAKYILDSAEGIVGKPLVQTILEGYAETILDGDRRNRIVYEKFLLEQVMTKQVHVEIDETTTVEHRQHAFLAALQTIGAVALQQDTVVQTAIPIDPNSKWDD